MSRSRECTWVRCLSGRELRVLHPEGSDLRRMWAAAMEGAGPRLASVRVDEVLRKLSDHVEQVDLLAIEALVEGVTTDWDPFTASESLMP